ncbi:MAG: 50S ribosomal protein L13 [Endomicrobia bacterium]|nr:50S ribosomal protein L13 [Endomicrobiia bacterium]
MKITATIAKYTKFNYKTSRNWYVIDAANKVLGRVSSVVSKLLIGKHKPEYSPDKDIGDFVVVKNASKILLTGKKLKQKIYFRYSGYLGGDKYIPYEKLLPQRADFVVKEAVKGMLPKDKHRFARLKRLKVIKDDKINLTQKLIEINV